MLGAVRVFVVRVLQVRWVRLRKVKGQESPHSRPRAQPTPLAGFPVTGDSERCSPSSLESQDQVSGSSVVQAQVR